MRTRAWRTREIGMEATRETKHQTELARKRRWERKKEDGAYFRGWVLLKVVHRGRVSVAVIWDES
jgi:hypothetical protein